MILQKNYVEFCIFKASTHECSRYGNPCFELIGSARASFTATHSEAKEHCRPRGTRGGSLAGNYLCYHMTKLESAQTVYRYCLVKEFATQLGPHQALFRHNSWHQQAILLQSVSRLIRCHTHTF